MDHVLSFAPISAVSLIPKNYPSRNSRTECSFGDSIITNGEIDGFENERLDRKGRCVK